MKIEDFGKVSLLREQLAKADERIKNFNEIRATDLGSAATDHLASVTVRSRKNWSACVEAIEIPQSVIADKLKADRDDVVWKLRELGVEVV